MMTLSNRHGAEVHTIVLNIARMDLANLVWTTPHKQLVEFIEENFPLGPTTKLASIFRAVGGRWVETEE
jgi:hypothetical protein